MSLDRKYFRYSSTVKWITGACLSLSLSLGILGFFQMQDIYEYYRNSVLHTIALMVPLIVLVGILLYFAFRATRYYVYLPNGLYLNFLLGGLGGDYIPMKDTTSLKGGLL